MGIWDREKANWDCHTRAPKMACTGRLHSPDGRDGVRRGVRARQGSLVPQAAVSSTTNVTNPRRRARLQNAGETKAKPPISAPLNARTSGPCVGTTQQMRVGSPPLNARTCQRVYIYFICGRSARDLQLPNTLLLLFQTGRLSDTAMNISLRTRTTKLRARARARNV